jgi:hypothetical protein
LFYCINTNLFLVSRTTTRSFSVKNNHLYFLKLFVEQHLWLTSSCPLSWKMSSVCFFLCASNISLFVQCWKKKIIFNLLLKQVCIIRNRLATNIISIRKKHKNHSLIIEINILSDEVNYI